MSHVTRNAKRGSLGEFRNFRDREGRARQECDSFRTEVFGWTKVILFLYLEVRKYFRTKVCSYVPSYVKVHCRVNVAHCSTIVALYVYVNSCTRTVTCKK